jgi:hypothetical protein
VIAFRKTSPIDQQVTLLTEGGSARHGASTLSCGRRSDTRIIYQANEGGRSTVLAILTLQVKSPEVAREV